MLYLTCFLFLFGSNNSLHLDCLAGFSGGSAIICPKCRWCRRCCLIPGSGIDSGGGHGHPLQYSCRENPMDREAWKAVVHRVAKSRAWLKQVSTHAHCIVSVFANILVNLYILIHLPYLLLYLLWSCNCNPWSL